VTAQITNTRFFEFSEASFKQPRFIGNIDGYYLVSDNTGAEGTALYCFDAAFELVTKTFLSYAAYQSEVTVNNNSIRLSWPDPQKKGTIQKLISINEGTLAIKDKSVYKTASSFYTNFYHKEADKYNRYQLYAAVNSLADKKYTINGFLTDSLGNVIKEIQYIFERDPEFQQEPKLLVDVKGNIHILILDKLSTYHISTTVWLTTFYMNREDPVTETHLMHKIKFGDFLFSDNLQLGKIQIQGFYCDGQNQTKVGLATVMFPYNGGEEPVTRLQPVTAEFQQKMRKGLRHIAGRDNIMNSLFPRYFFEKDGYLIAAGWVKDISEREMRKDKDWLAMQEHSMQFDNYTYGGGSSYNSSLVNRWLSDAEAVNTSVPRTGLLVDPRTPGVVGVPGTPAFPDANTTPPSVVGNGLSEADKNRAYGNMERASSGNSLFGERRNYINRSEKLVYWVIDDSGYCRQYGIVKETVSDETKIDIRRLFANPYIHEGYLQFGHDDTETKKNALLSNLPKNRYSNTNWSVPVEFEKDKILFMPVSNNNGQYAGLFMNTKTGKFGITLFECKERIDSF
jgi:hypothetical protein